MSVELIITYKYNQLEVLRRCGGGGGGVLNLELLFFFLLSARDLQLTTDDHLVLQ